LIGTFCNPIDIRNSEYFPDSSMWGRQS
jgi:hypothetical protein